LASAQQAGGKTQVLADYGRLPLSFEVNRGQTGDQVKFVSHGPGFSLFLTPTEAVLALSTPRTLLTNALHIKLVGANPEPGIRGLEELASKSNYFIGNDPSKWQTDVPNYAKVRYMSVYPGVDLAYYGNQRQLEHDFIVSPGADPCAITLGINHGFVRSASGHIATFDAPGGTGGTFARSINDQGAIAGYYTDAKNVNHGFVRDAQGHFTTFDAPGAVYGTVAHGINAAGEVSGAYSDANANSRGFIRDAQGHFTTFDAPANSINAYGVMAGYSILPVPNQ